MEAFGEPAIDRSEQFAGLIPFALIAREPRHAHRGAQFYPVRARTYRTRSEIPLRLRRSLLGEPVE